MSTIFGEPFVSMVRVLKGDSSEYEATTSKEKYRTETTVRRGSKTVCQVSWDDGDTMFEAVDEKADVLAFVWVREGRHIEGYRYRTASSDQLEPDDKTKDKIWELFYPDDEEETDA